MHVTTSTLCMYEYEYIYYAFNCTTLVCMPNTNMLVIKRAHQHDVRIYILCMPIIYACKRINIINYLWISIMPNTYACNQPHQNYVWSNIYYAKHICLQPNASTLSMNTYYACHTYACNRATVRNTGARRIRNLLWPECSVQIDGDARRKFSVHNGSSGGRQPRCSYITLPWTIVFPWPRCWTHEPTRDLCIGES